MPPDMKAGLLTAWEKALAGLVYFVDTKDNWTRLEARNLNISQCFSCGEISVWVHDRLVFPTPTQGPPPNPDLPDEISGDYEEAGRVLNDSPRGAAALLRLAIQKLCRHLGERGKHLDDDIASLVKRGLLPTVQKALDAVRVIGNEAVHPGILELRDDRDTASRLFELVNIITEQMISNPKRVDELYERLPESKRRAIEQRDGRTEDEG